MLDEMMVEIIKDDNLSKIYKAIQLLDSVDEEYNVKLSKLRLEKLLLLSIGYKKDYYTREYKKIDNNKFYK